jgi:type II secretory pathway component PulC
MSIINEALKKTEASIQKNSAKETLLPVKRPGFGSYIFYILILAAGLILINLIFAIMHRKTQPIQVSEPVTVSPTPDMEPQNNQELPAVTPPPLPKEQEKQEKKFILNGIFFSDNDGYALVNNRIVRENDLVDGVKVEKITADTVELNNEGNIITLTTNR